MFREERLNFYGIQSSKSYAMDTDWVGTGQEDPWRIFEDSVLKLEDIILDIKVYLDRPTPEGQTIVSLSSSGRFCEKNLFESRDHFYYGRCQSLSVPPCLQGDCCDTMYIDTRIIDIDILSSVSLRQ